MMETPRNEKMEGICKKIGSELTYIHFKPQNFRDIGRQIGFVIHFESESDLQEFKKGVEDAILVGSLR